MKRDLKSSLKRKNSKQQNKKVHFDINLKSDEEDKVSLSKRYLMKKRQI